MHGVAYVNGTVDTAEQAEALRAATHQADGVRRVVGTVEVRETGGRFVLDSPVSLP